jgi:hypothetical protein
MDGAVEQGQDGFPEHDRAQRFIGNLDAASYFKPSSVKKVTIFY